jgi:predicted DNA-binding protein YlxM (UPF0122 family)
MKLYEIASQYETLIDFDMETDEDVQAFMALMGEIQDDFNVKAESICKLVKTFQAEAEAFKAEKLRLEKRQKALENKADALKNYLAFNAKEILTAGEKRTVGLFKIGFRKNPPKLVIDPDAIIPQDFYDWTPNTTALKQAIKDGEEIPGVRLESSESFVIQ